MDEPRARSETSRRFCGTVAGDGRPGPIEERIGRRLVRLLDPESDEGARLLEAGNVELVGPEGATLGRVRLGEAYRRLRSRLMQRLSEEGRKPQRDELEEGLERLDTWASRLATRPREPERST